MRASAVPPTEPGSSAHPAAVATGVPGDPTNALIAIAAVQALDKLARRCRHSQVGCGAHAVGRGQHALRAGARYQQDGAPG